VTGKGTQIFLEMNDWQVGEVILEPGESMGLNSQLLVPKSSVTLTVQMTETGAIVIRLQGEVFDQAEEEKDESEGQEAFEFEPDETAYHPQHIEDAVGEPVLQERSRGWLKSLLDGNNK
jgi:hypothetical protein